MARHTSSSHSPSSRREKEKERERERSPAARRHRNSHSRHNSADSPPPRHRSISPPVREKHRHSDRGSGKPVRESSASPPPPPPPGSCSPSPRTKRLKRDQSDRERDRESERNHGTGKDRDRDRDRGRGSDRDVVMAIERKEKRGSGRDENEDNHNDSGRNRSSRSRHERSGTATASQERQHNGRSRHRSRSPQHHAAANAKPRDEVTNSRGAEHRNDENDSMEKMKAAEEALEEKQKQKPSFELSGKLAAETNRVRGVTLLFNEPPEARKPDIKWRLYVFKAGEVLNEPLYIHRQSCYLFGRERRVADIPTDHPSCSKQHAVIQFRQVEVEQPDGMLSKKIRPYIMDLGSTNKTFVNDSPVEPQRYYELREKDTIKFGNSSREYVLLHENSIS